MLGVFRNTFTCNDKYPVQDCENLLSPIQMTLFVKPKNFSNSFVSLLESTSNFKHFEKKEDRHRYFISDITDCQRLGKTNHKKHRFRAPFDIQDVKGYQTFAKSA